MSVIISVKDSVMNSAVPPVGEMLGPELVTGTDSDMSGANNWIGNSLGAFDINSTVAGKMYMLGDGGQDFAQLSGITEVGKKYRISLKAKLNSGVSTEIRCGANIGIVGAFISLTPTGTDGVYVGDITATAVNLFIGLLAGFAGVAFEIDDVSVREIL